MDDRQIDRQIGEKLFGWKWFARECTYTHERKRYLVNPERILCEGESLATGEEPFWEGSDVFLPHYSTDIAAAWSIIQHFKQRTDRSRDFFADAIDDLTPMNEETIYALSPLL